MVIGPGGAGSDLLRPVVDALVERGADVTLVRGSADGLPGYAVQVPDVPEELTPLVQIVPLQLIALELALYALGVGPGDEVVTTSRTFIASASAAVARGATPVCCEVDADTQNMTVEAVEAVLTPATRAIVAVVPVTVPSVVPLEAKVEATVVTPLPVATRLPLLSSVAPKPCFCISVIRAERHFVLPSPVVMLTK